MKTCAKCKTPATRTWSPPELDGYYISVCAACYELYREDRRLAMLNLMVQPIQGEL